MLQVGPTFPRLPRLLNFFPSCFHLYIHFPSTLEVDIGADTAQSSTQYKAFKIQMCHSGVQSLVLAGVVWIQHTLLAFMKKGVNLRESHPLCSQTTHSPLPWVSIPPHGWYHRHQHHQLTDPSCCTYLQDLIFAAHLPSGTPLFNGFSLPLIRILYSCLPFLLI